MGRVRRSGRGGALISPSSPIMTERILCAADYRNLAACDPNDPNRNINHITSYKNNPGRSLSHKPICANYDHMDSWESASKMCQATWKGFVVNLKLSLSIIYLNVQIQYYLILFHL